MRNNETQTSNSSTRSRHRIVNVPDHAMTVFLLIVLGLLLCAFTGAMLSEYLQNAIGKYLGLTNKNEILRFLGIGMGGVLVTMQALMSYKRAKALEDTAKAQSDAARAQARATEEQAKANQNTERGQRQERLKNAIEHLGSAFDSVRMGGAHELFHLAEDTPSWRQTILDILCAHIRQTTSQAPYRDQYKSHPSEEVQTLLTLLFVREHDVFEDGTVNLKGSWLCGAELSEGRLDWADLTATNLQNASLYRARLQWALLFDAQLRGAQLVSARLYGASLYGAQLQGANLGRALLHGANLLEAQLHGANLAMVQMQGAILGGAQLQGAHLHGTDLRGVRCEEDLSKTTEERIRNSIDQESDLSWIWFSGGLKRKDIDSVVDGLPGEEKRELRSKLAPHIDQPESHEPPQGCDIITGSYSAKEAEEWIEKHERTLP